MDKLYNILKDLNFKFNKQFGQNFITDENLLDSMVTDSGITSEDTVVEIGTGAGTLTKAIAKVAKRVVSYEIDRNLMPVLSHTLAGLDDTVEVIFKDILKVSDKELADLVVGDYKVVANLPYYITTPIIMRFLESDYPPTSLSIMVQKEVAERLTAKCDTEDYGAITVAVNLVADVKVTRVVGRKMFVPEPKVDSAIIRLDINKQKYSCDVEKVKKLVKASFIMRRKTLINNLIMYCSKTREELAQIINSMGLDERVRGEVLSCEQFILLYEKLK